MAEEFAGDFAPKDMPISEMYASSIRNAYASVRDTAAKSSLVLSKTEPKSKDAVDFDFDTELRKTRRLTLIDRPRYRYKTLRKDDKRMAGEPEGLTSSEDEDDDGLAREQSSYAARRPFTHYDRESTVYGNRRYYSRKDNEDPDYFDSDLRHSIDLYRKPKPVTEQPGSYFNSRQVCSNPALWNSKDFKELCSYKPDRLLSKQLYSDRTKKLLEDDSVEGGAEGETVAAATTSAPHVEIDRGLMSAALRTPSYWTKRFEGMTRQK